MRAALLLASVASLGACGGGADEPLHVWAAASLRETITELAERWEQLTGREVALNLAGSNQLALQIERTGRADVFVSASEREMDRVENAGLVAPGTRRALLANQLVVVVPVGAPPRDGFDVTDDWPERLSLANPAIVPAGVYARRWLEERSLWDALAPRVLAGSDVRAALAAVEVGAADAGIVYRTDAALTERVRVLHAVPVDEGPPIRYLAAAIAERPAPQAARDFLAFLASDEARTLFESAGFVVLESETATR